MIGIVVLCFLPLQLLPGDAADVLRTESGSATAATMVQMRGFLGLDQPMLRQPVTYVAHETYGFVRER